MDFSNCKLVFNAHSLSLSPVHCPDMTNTVEEDVKSQTIHTSNISLTNDNQALISLLCVVSYVSVVCVLVYLLFYSSSWCILVVHLHYFTDTAFDVNISIFWKTGYTNVIQIQRISLQGLVVQSIVSFRK